MNRALVRYAGCDWPWEGLGLQAHPQKDMRVRALAIGLKAARGGGSPIF